jgi:hypothetical protein
VGGSGVANERDQKSVQNFSRKPEGDHVGDQSIDRRIILKCFLNN